MPRRRRGLLPLPEVGDRQLDPYPLDEVGDPTEWDIAYVLACLFNLAVFRRIGVTS